MMNIWHLIKWIGFLGTLQDKFINFDGNSPEDIILKGDIQSPKLWTNWKPPRRRHAKIGPSAPDRDLPGRPRAGQTLDSPCFREIWVNPWDNPWTNMEGWYSLTSWTGLTIWLSGHFRIQILLLFLSGKPGIPIIRILTHVPYSSIVKAPSTGSRTYAPRSATPYLKIERRSRGTCQRKCRKHKLPKDHQTIQAQWDPFHSPLTVKALTCWLVLDLPSGYLI